MGVTLVILIIVAIAIWYFAKYQSTASHFASSDHDPVGSINGPGEYDIEVVGESHYQRALESICGGRTEESAEKYVKAQLILEDENSHDPYAVRVDIQGKTIGYLARKTAHQY